MDLLDRLRTDANPAWSAYVEHEFVCRLGDGSLPRASFRHYLAQDYLFLIQFARAYALAAYKGRTLDELRNGIGGAEAILGEMTLHVRLSSEWGVSEADLAGAQESRATTAYTRFVLDAGMRGDLLDLQVALAPCIIGYAEIGTMLAGKEPGRAEDNPYRGWIAEYSGEAYQAVATKAREELSRLGEIYLSEARYPMLLALFRQATLLEADFWQMGLDLAD